MTQREPIEMDVYENEKGLTAIRFANDWFGTFGHNTKRNEIFIGNKFQNFQPKNFLGSVYSYFSISDGRYSKVNFKNVRV